MRASRRARASGADLPRLGKVQCVERLGRTLYTPPNNRRLGLRSAAEPQAPSPGRCLRTPGPPAQTRRRDCLVLRPGRSAFARVTPPAIAASSRALRPPHPSPAAGPRSRAGWSRRDGQLRGSQREGGGRGWVALRSASGRGRSRGGGQSRDRG